MLWNLSNFPRAAADRCWKAAAEEELGTAAAALLYLQFYYHRPHNF